MQQVIDASKTSVFREAYTRRTHANQMAGTIQREALPVRAPRGWTWVSRTIRSAYERLGTERDPVRRAAELSAQTIIFDVEPLVVSWNGSQESLDRGVELVVSQVREQSGARAVCFATNSSRRPTRLPRPPGIALTYFASARKPLRTRLYRGLPRPGVVIGDQAATDGVLAYRLGYTFLHYCPEVAGVPLGSRLLSHVGRIVVLSLFRDATAQPPDRL